METKNIAGALAKLIAEVGPIIKQMDVPTGGQNSYKAVSDKDVKEKVGKKMAELGLSIVPTGIDAREHIKDFTDKYGNPKSNVYTFVTTKYLLLHTSGESIELTGYGHGIDSQDKAAGKATTYALKYLLLYLTLAPTGGAEDFVEDRPEDMSPTTVAAPEKPKTTPQQNVANFEKESKNTPAAKAAPEKPAAEKSSDSRHNLVFNDEKWPRVKEWVVANKGKDPDWIIEKLSVNNLISEETKNHILDLLK